MNEKKEHKEDKPNNNQNELQGKSPEENEVWFKTNLDYIGRSYSAYLYFLLIIAITTTTYLISSPNTVVDSNWHVNVLDFTLSLGKITANRMYLIILTWLVYFLALDFVEHRYVNHYNQILSFYYSKKSVFFIERKRYISEIFKYPAKVVVKILIPLLERILSLLKKAQ